MVEVSVDLLVGLLAGNIVNALGFFALGLVAYWAFDEWEDADDGADHIERVGDRADNALGNVAGGGKSLIIVAGAIATTLAQEILSTILLLDQLVGGMPFAVGHFVFGILTFLGLWGFIPITIGQLGIVFLVITLVALIAFAKRWRGAPS